MKMLVELSSIFAGFYFIAYSGRLIILRNSGYTALFKVLDGIFGYLPFLSVAVLLIVGTVSIVRTGRPRSLIKLPDRCRCPSGCYSFSVSLSAVSGFFQF